ncbi:thioredoxin domain-containing protein [Asanoa sp. WMMD1127]|uniref:thioredoxin family protein n=1 Tax=Asanoa sp. WMMD1127 TaxID=3016107 RepID=UPI002416C35A|nr:thioredoxin domain-containing protein [Asanoa sp. WMMD1127]MDG4825894.1 thioredoxin domain-containing protein [Asanoa sp. WMMD1127]
MLRQDLLVTVTDDTFAAEVLAAPTPVVVDVWAEWCPPCHAISRSLGELAEELAGRLVVATLDADENPATTRAYQVRSLPTLLIFRAGELVSATVGARPKSALRTLLTEHC